MKTFLDVILAHAQGHVGDPRAAAYLARRGASPAQVQALGIGYVPEDAWPPYVGGASEDEEAYREWSGKGARLKGKVVFPMHNALGHVRGIQIRSPDPDKKDYTKYYLGRSKVDALFFGTPLAMPTIWARREVYLCEGIFDFFPLQRAFPNTLCTGTANVSARQIEFLHRFVDSVYVVFDTDWGGKEFYRRFQDVHGHAFRNVQRIDVRGKDVSEMWERFGEDKFREMMMARVL